MGKRIIITEAERIEILKKYGLNEGIPEYLEAGAAAFFFYSKPLICLNLRLFTYFLNIIIAVAIFVVKFIIF